MRTLLLAALATISLHALTEPLTGTKGALAFTRNGEAWIMNTDGSSQTQLTQRGDVRQTRVANGVVAFIGGNRIYAAPIAGFTLAAPPTPVPNTDGVLEFDLAPDASKAVLTYFADSNTTLFTINLDGSALTPINSAGLHQFSGNWASNGLIYFGQSSIGNAFSQTVYSIPENGVNNPTVVTGYFSQFPALGGPSNRIAFLMNFPVKTLRVVNQDGTGAFDVPGVDAGDGGTIAYDLEQEVIYYRRFTEIHRVNADGSNHQLLTQGVWDGVDYGRVPFDNSAPVITSSVTGLPGQNNWFRGDVTVTWTVADAESGISSSSGCAPQTITAETPGVTLTCSATNNAGLTTTRSVTVKLDRTAPVLSAVQSPLPNANGWNNTNVTVNFACLDALSGLASLAPSVAVLTAEGAGQSAAASCTDQAGNTATTAITGINIDKTAPTLTNLTATPNPARVNTAITLAATMADQGGSGLAPANTAVAPFATAGIYNLCLQARDLAGNTSPNTCIDVPVYDPAAGYLKGGGKIQTPAGRGQFEFESEYRNGAAVPTGQLEYQTDTLKFKSKQFSWMVITGNQGIFTGQGTLNDAPGYRFEITAVDGPDRFRIRIWNSAGSLVYDTAPLAALLEGNVEIRH